MMMGTYTFQQYWFEQRGVFGAMPVKDPSIRFSELLTQSRVRTANITSMHSLLGERGIMRGFKHDGKAGKATKDYTPAAKVIEEVSKFLDTRRPIFTASHLGDPHEPYDLAGRKGTPFRRYLGEVALVDKALGQLLERLSSEKFSRRTVLIVSADHGESFGEHDSSSHGTTVYDEVLHVPMFLYAPDVEPRMVDDLVSLIDIGPTVLDLFDLPTPAHFMGQSLAPYLRGETPKLTRPIIGEARSLLAYVTPERLKVILDTDTGRTELYDLRKDPLELDNIADDTARLARPLAYLEKFYETHRLRRKGYTPPPIR
jgi:arylsulfatase A-like enzyme